MKLAPCLLALILLATPAIGLELGVSLRHYAQDMEFYYLKPRPASIDPLLRKLSGAGALALPENRLMLAAFLSRLSRAKSLDLAKLIENNLDSSRDIKRTLAWSARLAALKNEDEALDKLLGKNDEVLYRQIKSMPRELERWRIDGRAALRTRLAAFMADGDSRWLDDIIRAAISRRGPSQYAAAIIYEYAPRHPALVERAREAMTRVNPDARRLLRQTLRGVDESGN